MKSLSQVFVLSTIPLGRGTVRLNLRIHACSCWLVVSAMTKVLERLSYLGILKPESRLYQSAREDAAALDNQLGLGSQENGAHLEHPARCGQTEWHTADAPHESHHLAIGQRVGRDQVDVAFEARAMDQPFN